MIDMYDNDAYAGGSGLYNMERHLILSGSLAYQLTAADRKTVLQNVHKIILDECNFSDADSRLLLDALDYICDAYGDRHRRLGPPAVLHPIRATAVMARAVAPSPDILELLAVLFHDKLEDLPEDAYKDEEPWVFQKLEERFYELIDRVDTKRRDVLTERLKALTCLPGQSYNSYIGSLLKHAASDPGTLRCKLADRLDNTLDMRLDYQDTLRSTNFYRVIFNILFVNSRNTPSMSHPIKSEMNGEQRLRQLFKNIVMLSIIRRDGSFPIGRDLIIDRLCDALVTATSLEAQRNILHIFNYHLPDGELKRQAIMSAMEYCQNAGIERITPSSGASPLDGLFSYFAKSKDGVKPNEKFRDFYDNKPLMVQACLAFMAICAKFSTDADFYVQGITQEEISPV